MQIESWYLYLSVAFVATVTPGPAVLLVSSRSLEPGLTKCLGVILGNVSGLFLLCLAAILGLTTVLLVSSTAFTLVKMAGAAYLIYLGIKMLRKSGTSSATAGLENSQPSMLSGYVEGVVLAISNPKALLFTTALFPQFMDRSLPLLPQFGVMVPTLMVLSFLCLSAYAYAARRFGKQLFATHGKHMQRLFGSAYIFAGTTLMATSK